MKAAILSVLLCLSTSGVAFASDITNKSLRVGKSANPAPFAACVASQALDQLLATSDRFARLMHGAADISHQPAMTATLAFLTEKIGDAKRSIYKVELASLDPSLGWQLIQDSTGEVAPFSTSISNRAVLRKADGGLVGNVDLSACADR